MDVVLDFLATGDFQVAPSRCAAADKHGVITLREQLAHRIHTLTALEGDPHVQDVTRLFVDHRLGQAKTRDLAANESPGLGLAVEHRDVIAQRRQISRHRQRGRTGAHTGDAFAVLRADLGHAALDVFLVVRRHPLQAANRHRLWMLAVTLFDPAAPAGGLAGTVASAPEHAGKHVGHPVDHVGIAVAALPDQADVFWHGGVGRAGPLTIDDFMKVRRIGGVGRLQRWLLVRGPATIAGLTIRTV